jgi:hypothetical protein
MYMVSVLLIKALLVTGLHKAKWSSLTHVDVANQQSHMFSLLTDKKLQKLMEITYKNELCNTSI